MPNRTRMSSAIRMIAWPSCKFRLRVGLVRVLGTVDRISSDDDVVANCLLYQWSDRLERVPERHLERLVSVGCHGLVAARGRRIIGKLAARSIGRAVARRARVSDEDPAGVGRRLVGGTLRDAAVGDGTVGARVGQDNGDGVTLGRCLDIAVLWPVVRSAVRVDEVGGSHRDPGALVGGLLERDVQVKPAAEVDDAERQQQDDRRDDCELGQTLRSLASEVRLQLFQSLFHGLPWIVKCSLYARFRAEPNMPWMNGVMSWNRINNETLMSPSQKELSVGWAGIVPEALPLGAV